MNLLRKSLLSLNNQIIKPNELILSDDGSTEDIVNGISGIIKTFGFPVKFVRQEHNGFRLARCRNNGVRNADGELLLFLDQDLVITKNYIEKFVANYKSERFLTSYPIRLNEEQSSELTEERILNYDFTNIIKSDQIIKIRAQFRKDYLSYILHRSGLQKGKPKLRGGACAIALKDFERVNGYDEHFMGWGNEDDDLRRRLYEAGLHGYNPHKTEFPMHLYHKPFHDNGKRVNQDYNDFRKLEIKRGEYKCKYGLNNTLGDDKVDVTIIN